jgi:hypothetical protein
MPIFIKNGGVLTNQHEWIVLPDHRKQLVPLNNISANTANTVGLEIQKILKIIINQKIIKKIKKWMIKN